MTAIGDVAPADILAFWREAGRERWYKRDDAFDADVRARFLDLWQRAAAGELSSWEATDDGALALVIVLDQFPRNMFRGDIRTWWSDPLAREVADRAIARGADQRIEAALLEFIYMRSCIRSFWPTSFIASNCSAGPAPPIVSGLPKTTPALSAGSGAFRIAIPSWDARRRRKNKPFSTVAGFPADDRTVKAPGHCCFRGAEYCAGRPPGLRNIRTVRENRR
jgi:Bacterial protein of unknown function (DUF924)